MKTLLTTLALIFPVAVLAHDYSYVDGGVVDGHAPNRDGSDMGFRLSGSAPLAEPVAVFGEIVDTGPYSHLTAGTLYHTSFTSTLDAHVGGALEFVDAGFEDDTGVGLYTGLRWQVPGTARRFEISPELRHRVVLGETSTSVRNSLLLRMAPQLDMLGAVQAGDEDRVELGVRYNFGAKPLTH